VMARIARKLRAAIGATLIGATIIGAPCSQAPLGRTGDCAGRLRQAALAAAQTLKRWSSRREARINRPEDSHQRDGHRRDCLQARVTDMLTSATGARHLLQDLRSGKRSLRCALTSTGGESPRGFYLDDAALSRPRCAERQDGDRPEPLDLIASRCCAGTGHAVRRRVDGGTSARDATRPRGFPVNSRASAPAIVVGSTTPRLM